jgi:asparagine synthase (glutamine-hydrolysing)
MTSLKGKLDVDETTLRRMRESLEKSVEKHLMSEVPFGVLLSGGLDSSLIAAIAARQVAKAARNAMPFDSQDALSPAASSHALNQNPTTAMWSQRLHSVCAFLPSRLNHSV